MKTWIRPLNIGIVGATGVVGETLVNLLEEYAHPINEFRPFASDKSKGQKFFLAGTEWEVQSLSKNCFENLDIVFFSSGDEISEEWVPLAVQSGAFAIDNSNAFRMIQDIKLIVPEVNGDLINSKSSPQIISNPNCSTIQLTVALKPLSDAFGITDVTVATYQAVSGAGLPGYQELLDQTKNYAHPEQDSKVFPKQILFNCIPQIGGFSIDGFCSEETKIMNETKKIMRLPQLKVSATTVRIPALNGHSEAVWVTLNKLTDRETILKTMDQFPGLAMMDQDYPTALEVSGEDPVFVGRVRQDPGNPYRWLMWIVSDNLKKGAALNALQIADLLFAG